ncbi:MAG TPA: VWA domain-containing protein [Terriglobia bacterium]|jgi:VWFA-related protein
MRRRFYVLAVFAAVTAATVIRAQVRVDVRLVNVIATVTDTHGRYVSNLAANDFTLEEDGNVQAISHFSQDQEVPVSVGVLLDTSGSMDRKIRTAVDSVDRFIHRIRQDDEIFLITFSGQAVLRQDFTDNRDKLSQALRHITPTGGTALYDALNEGLTKLRSAHHSKRALLVITDGQDTASVSKLEHAVQAIRASEVLVYPIGISSLTYAGNSSPPSIKAVSALMFTKKTSESRRDDVDLNVLRTLAESSGGRPFLLAESFSGRGAQIEKVLDVIADELRSQYTLGFYPARPDDGRYHQLHVRVRTGDQVRARRGYIATAS